MDTLRLFPEVWLLLVHTTLHLSVELGACIILRSLDWVHGWMMNICVLEFVETKNQLADIFTKLLPKESFFTIRRELGIVDQSDLDS